MSRRIRVGRGLHGRQTRDLSRRLKGIITNYRFALITKKRARELGRAAIDDEFETLLRASRDRVRTALRRPVELPPEERRRLERWRDDYIGDFNAILADVK